MSRRAEPGAWLALVAALAVSGCAAKDRRSSGAPPAGLPSPMQAQTPTPERVVFFRGFVRHSVVPWTEGLTLARGLLQAEYTGFWDPHLITITRQGETLRINPRRLLAGLEDPPLQPGDVVEVQR